MTIHADGTTAATSMPFAPDPVRPLSPVPLTGLRPGTTGTDIHTAAEVQQLLDSDQALPAAEEVIPPPTVEPEAPITPDAVLWQEACDRYFEEQGWMDFSEETSEDLSPANSSHVPEAVDHLAAAASLAIALGGYWAAPQPDREHRKRYPAPILSESV
jgi:hypothetical protein